MMNIVETDDYVRINEAAQLIGCSPAAIRVAIAENRLPMTIDHGVRWILRDDALAYKNRTQPNGQKAKGRPPGAGDQQPRKKRGSPER